MEVTGTNPGTGITEQAAGTGGGHGRRLDSWKAIADYLQRDVATVRRWEKQGLPVRRVPGGRGTSVYAFQSDVDAWLAAGQPREMPEPLAAEPTTERSRVEPKPLATWLMVAVVVLAVAGVAVGAWRAANGRPGAGDIHIAVDSDGIVATDNQGDERWRISPPAGTRFIRSENDLAGRVIDGAQPGVYAISAYVESRTDQSATSGQLFALTLDGQERWRFAFDDRVTFGGKAFGPPWAVTSFAVTDTPAGRRVAVAAHDYHWSPSLVAIVDDAGRRLATFGHSGWLEQLRWLSSERLLVGGFSESQNGGLLALLDASHVEGRGPEPAGSPHHCDTCGDGLPLRMVVMPRSEVNLASHSRFNRAVLELPGDHVVARTIEVPSVGQEAVDAIYEFTRDLQLVSARYSERYWEIHAALEGQGRLDHTRDTCPDRDGPRELIVWDPDGGWRRVPTR